MHLSVSMDNEYEQIEHDKVFDCIAYTSLLTAAVMAQSGLRLKRVKRRDQIARPNSTQLNSTKSPQFAASREILSMLRTSRLTD